MNDCGPEAAPLRALIIDDYRAGLKLTSLSLRRLGCDVRGCADSSECVAVARDFRPELILLDLFMPHVDGFTVAQQLRDADLPPFLLVAHTGLDQAEVTRRCEEAGFDAVLEKPATKSDLEGFIAEARRLSAHPTA
jgi:two-component system OmpR family response regulator